MGDITYRTVRGRTIGSQKIGSRGQGHLGQSVRQFAFALMNRFMVNHRDDIKVSFNKTKYGSQANYFIQVNYLSLLAAFTEIYTPLSQASGVSNADIDHAVFTYADANDKSIYRVKKAGYPVKYLGAEWNSNDNPDGGKHPYRISIGNNKLVMKFVLGAPVAAGLVTGVDYNPTTDNITIVAPALGTSGITAFDLYNLAGTKIGAITGGSVMGADYLSFGLSADPFAAVLSVSYLVATTATASSFNGNYLLTAIPYV